jgi:NhaP-type Na+/H+ or K+/H+ antiporter
LNELLSEVARRDEWLIDSIWNVVVQLSNLTVFVVIGVIVLMNGYTDGWQLGLAIGGYFLLTFLMGLRSKRLQADDKIRIGRGSTLGPFASWWK